MRILSQLCGAWRGLAPGLVVLGLLGLPTVASAITPELQRGRSASFQAQRERPVAPGEATVTLAGRLVYEDHRTIGRHGLRVDLDGRRGRSSGGRTTDSQFYLGAFHMVVDVYEQDRVGRTGRACVPLEWVGAATVQRDGSFSVEVPAEDRCRRERGGDPQYVLRAQTRYCRDELCFQIGRQRGRPYTLWFGLDDPLPTGATGAAAPTLLFSPEQSGDRNPWSRAANHYASLVDTVVSLHVEGGIPFRREEFGPVYVRFPSPWSDGRATADDTIDANNRGWPKGSLLMHEYGHIVHRRAWGGDYAGFHDPIQRWSGKRRTKEVPFIALKEGWANFVTSYVTGRCFRARYDTPEALASVKRGVNGTRFPQNHHHALCDWVDDREDRRPGAPKGARDTANLTILELWQLLDQTDALMGAFDGHDPVTEGLDVCDVVAAQGVADEVLDGPTRAQRMRDSWGVLQTNAITCPALDAAVRALPPEVVPEAPAEVPAESL